MTEKQNIDWRKILSEYKVSGESVGSFCKKRRISKSTLYYWLAKDEEPQEPVKLLPVINTVSREPDFVELILSKGKRLRFSPGASPNYVVSIINALT